LPAESKRPDETILAILIANCSEGDHSASAVGAASPHKRVVWESSLIVPDNAGTLIEGYK
jgi:hypothetical protein